MEKATTCTETDGNRLERQKTNRKPVHGAANASKNRWRVLGMGKVGRGVRQGCPLSPLLFNIYIEELVREAVEDLEEGIKVGRRWIKALRFADDQAMVAKSQKGLQTMMEEGIKVGGRWIKALRFADDQAMVAKS